MSHLIFKSAIAVVGTTLLAGCGAVGASPSAKSTRGQTISVVACTEGEARDTVICVRNLNDYEWAGAALRVSKGGKTYVLGLEGLHISTSRIDPIDRPPERTRPVEPFADPSQFTTRGEEVRRDLKQGGAPVIRLASFAHLESVTVELPAPLESE